jgi:hypothetical protein
MAHPAAGVNRRARIDPCPLTSSFVEVDPSDPEAVALIAALDADLLERYPGMPIFGIATTGFRAAGGLFLIGRIDCRSAVCGALRPIDDGAVEVKRMSSVRNTGAAAWRAPCFPDSKSTPHTAAIGPSGSKPARGSRRPSRCTVPPDIDRSPATASTLPTLTRAVSRRA